MGLHQEDGSVRLMHVRLEPALVQRAHGVLQGVCLFVSVSVPVAVSVSVSVSVCYKSKAEVVAPLQRSLLYWYKRTCFNSTKGLALLCHESKGKVVSPS